MISLVIVIIIFLYPIWIISNLVFLSVLWLPILLAFFSLTREEEPIQYIFNQLRSIGDLCTFCCGFLSNKMGFYTSGDYAKTTFIEDLHYYDPEKTLFK